MNNDEVVKKIDWAMPGIYDADAEKVYNEINSLGERYTTEQIVDLARNPSSELHNCFEWDDSIAAEKYRLQQAQNIVRQLRVVIEEPEKETVTFRLITSTGERDHSYKSFKYVLEDKDEYQKLLEQAKIDARNFKNKYHTLCEFDMVFNAIDELLK